ncbi:MAG: TlpA family protein disulfide reductase [Bacteroidales bacterium]|nr:TlpA family protein disulfide reductase [Bacteroidales bacterium]
MKYLFSILLLSVFSLSLQGQSGNLPSVDVKNLDGESFDISSIDNDGNPIILSMWATWCKPCIRELNTIAEVYPDWQEETGVLVVAVSIDDSRTSSRVLPTVNSNYWDYEIYLDPNQDLKRALNVNMIPQTFLLNGNKKIVWQHTSFSEGSELKLIELVRKLKAGEDISNEE